LQKNEKPNFSISPDLHNYDSKLSKTRLNQESFDEMDETHDYGAIYPEHEIRKAHDRHFYDLQKQQRQLNKSKPQLSI